MNAPSDDIAQYLAAQGVGTFAATSGWAIYFAKEPQAPDSCVTVYDTSGDSPDPDSAFWRPSVQVRIRANDYRDAYAKVEDVVNTLTVNAISFAQGGTKYVGAFQFGSPQFIGFDDNDRAIVVVNFNLIRQPA